MDGTVIFQATNRGNVPQTGASVESLPQRDCDNPLLLSNNHPDPAAHRDQEWVTSLFSRDGQMVVGFVHNEYHGDLRRRRIMRVPLTLKRPLKT